MKTNYYPLWEAERGRFRLTHKIKKPMPLSELVGMIGKFSHLTHEEMASLEKEVAERYALIEGMTRTMPLHETRPETT